MTAAAAGEAAGDGAPGAGEGAAGLGAGDGEGGAGLAGGDGAGEGDGAGVGEGGGAAMPDPYSSNNPSVAASKILAGLMSMISPPLPHWGFESVARAVFPIKFPFKLRYRDNHENRKGIDVRILGIRCRWSQSRNFSLASERLSRLIGA